MFSVRLLYALCLLLPSISKAGEIYFSSFNVPPFTATGDDRIAGYDGWTGSSLHTNLKLHGIMSETAHGVIGIGNAGYLGGNYNNITVANNTANKLVWLRRRVDIDPLALNQEIATFGLSFGIKDSSSTYSYRRDNFDVLIYNQAGSVLAGLRFDNTSLDSSNNPRRLIYRLGYSGTGMVYTNTGYTFLAETMESLQYRINFRTNKWTATLGGVPLFEDIAFYTGAATKNLGYVLLQMSVTNPTVTGTTLLPGDNYMLFDDYMVRTDPVSTGVEVGRTASGAPKVIWNEEAGYSYRLQWSANCTGWQDVAATIHTATSTADYSYTDPVSPVPAKRFYRVKRTYP